jgi:asparagine synthase (glutamine-hydrolysing)
VSMEEFARELPGIVRDLDTPVADPAAVPLWFLAREARKRVKVVLSGEGADELFGGYRIYRQPWVVRAADRLPDRLRTPLAALGARLPAGLRGKGLLERMATPLPERYIGNARIFTEQELTRLTSSLPLAGHTSALDVTGPLWAGAGRLDDVAAMQHIDVNTWLVGDILVKADRMTMAHGLELRVPFLDPEVFRVTAALPRAAKVGRRTTKLALRRAMAGVVPEHVLWRPKLGFPVPIRHWLAGDLHDWAAEIIASAPAGDFIDTAYGLDLLRRHRLGKLDLSRRIWAVLVFSLWHRALVDPSPNQLITDQPPRALPRPPAPGRPGGSGHGLSGTG